MIAEMKFIEHLDKIHTKLEVVPSDDDPTKIYARAMIRDIKDNYQAQIDEFEKWAEAESQRETLPEGYSGVSVSSEKANLTHPGAFPGAKSE